ncbi:50S ribosomal protein L1 [Buchnera aphidicola (Thelaxes californica)]|uniref:Large ribosomal subunit protein uL1 n=1 Tax=Buchnera aphidicola (Thelaxes californica) TaxID=1315998 RepID=A0A4D6YJD9_9GAMM|nr:50S ribosomal protein L1 [Buchnera aphidicola]QCI26591.1 50S ribosomal protein L1 [Buchnera aphidicola (Thelaxes californica)]
MDKRIRTIRNLKKNIDLKKPYSFDEGLLFVKKSAIAKFVESIDVSIHLGIDPKKTDQNVRGTTVLPHGIGRNVTVAVFTKDTKCVQDAYKAGADLVGMEELAQKIKQENLVFDIVIASPDAMKVVSTIGSFLGPRGIMPNPKLGTITTNIFQAVTNAKLGQIKYKNDKNGILHATIGKANFTDIKLKENFLTLIKSIKKNKPNHSKGFFLKKIILSSTMGISIILDHSHLI